MRRLGFVLAWLLVAFVATGVAWAALSSADRQVGEVPLTPALNVSAGRPDPDETPTSVPDPPTTVRATPTSLPAPSTTTTSTSSTSSSTSPSTTSSTRPTTSTTSVPPSTTTTDDEDEWVKTTVPSTGGVVVVGHRTDQVRLESATPNPGFSMEVHGTGPDEVRVEFSRREESYDVRVRWDDDELDIQVSGEH